MAVESAYLVSRMLQQSGIEDDKPNAPQRPEVDSEIMETLTKGPCAGALP